MKCFLASVMSLFVWCTCLWRVVESGMVVPTSDYDDMSIADFQILGSLDSHNVRSSSNAPPLAVYDYSDYSITQQLEMGLRGLEFDVLPCDGDTSECEDYVMADTNIFQTDSSCETLSSCLSEVGAWSFSNKDNHVPIFIKIDAENLWISGKWDSLEAWTRLSEVIKTCIEEEYGSSDDSPILSYTSFVNDYDDSWESFTLGDARGKIFFYLTPEGTEVISTLVENEDDDSLYFNNWYSGVSDVLFACCTRRNREGAHCEFVQNMNSERINDLHSDRNYSHLFTTNVDQKFVQIEGYRFDSDADRVYSESMNVSLTNDWLAESWYYNIKLSPSTYDEQSESCTLTTSVTQPSDDTDYTQDDGFDICAFYDRVSYSKGSEDDAQRIITNLTNDGITSIANLQEFIDEIYIPYYWTIFAGAHDGRDYDRDIQTADALARLDSKANLIKTGYFYDMDVYGQDWAYNVSLAQGCTETYPSDADTSNMPVLKLDTMCFYRVENDDDDAVSKLRVESNRFVAGTIAFAMVLHAVW